MTFRETNWPARYLPAACTSATIDVDGALHVHQSPRWFRVQTASQASAITERQIMDTLDPECFGGLLRWTPLRPVGLGLHLTRDCPPAPPANEVATALSGWLTKSRLQIGGPLVIVGGWNPRTETYISLSARQLRSLRHFLPKAQEDAAAGEAVRRMRLSIAHR